MTIGVGLAVRVLLPEVESFDAELALPTLAQGLLPPVLVGMVSAGILAATISTANPQLYRLTYPRLPPTKGRSLPHHQGRYGCD